MLEVRLLIEEIDNEYLESVLMALSSGLEIYGSEMIYAEVRHYG